MKKLPVIYTRKRKSKRDIILQASAPHLMLFGCSIPPTLRARFLSRIIDIQTLVLRIPFLTERYARYAQLWRWFMGGFFEGRNLNKIRVLVNFQFLLKGITLGIYSKNNSPFGKSYSDGRPEREMSMRYWAIYVKKLFLCGIDIWKWTNQWHWTCRVSCARSLILRRARPPPFFRGPTDNFVVYQRTELSQKNMKILTTTSTFQCTKSLVGVGHTPG